MAGSTGDHLVLQLYSMFDGFVGKIGLPNSDIGTMEANSTQTVIVLDCSGSMEVGVKKLLKQVLPAVFRRLGYKDDNQITLITFGSNSSLYSTSAGELADLGIQARGRSYMADALRLLKGHLAKDGDSFINAPIRLLTVSDGALDDREETVQLASSMKPLLDGRLVNSKAIRYFTSQITQPDTRGLASILQFNNIASTHCGLLDIEASLCVEETVSAICGLFQDDGLNFRHASLTTSDAAIRRFPWDGRLARNSQLMNGDNFIWLKNHPGQVFVDDVEIAVNDCGPLMVNALSSFERNISNLISHIKLLKVVKSKEALQETETAKTYIDKWLNSAKLLETEQSRKTLAGRFKSFQNMTRRRIISALHDLACVANDEGPHTFNFAQQASYLQLAASSTSSKTTANETNFLGVLRSEVAAMSQHLSDLADIDDTSFVTSLYSGASTLAGIRNICELHAHREAFDLLSENEILQMVNIVGIACQASAGDHPDPIKSQIQKIYPGCFVSVSDLLVYIEQNGNNGGLKVPGSQDKTITSVVPYFDDARVQLFLQKYAPNLLEYSCSIGMPKQLVNVPLTFCYSMAAGISSLVPEIDNYKLETTISLFCRLVRSLGLALSWNADIKKNQNDIMPFLPETNQASSLISQIVLLAMEGRLQQTGTLSELLRATYIKEVYHAVANKVEIQGSTSNELRSLLGIDVDRYKTYEGDLFEDIVSPHFHREYHVNEGVFAKFATSFKAMDYITLWPHLVERVFSSDVDPVAAIKEIPPMSEQSICRALGINYDLKTFKLCNIVQALLFKMHFKSVVDLSTNEDAYLFLCRNVQKFYKADFNRRYKAKQQSEVALLATYLADSLLSSSTINEFKKLLRQGVAVKNKQYKLTCNKSLVCRELINDLLNPWRNVPHRESKMRIFISGRDGNEMVWNCGNPLRSDLYTQKLKMALKKMDGVHSFGRVNAQGNFKKRFFETLGNCSSIDQYFTDVITDDAPLYETVPNTAFLAVR